MWATVQNFTEYTNKRYLNDFVLSEYNINLNNEILLENAFTDKAKEWSVQFVRKIGKPITYATVVFAIITGSGCASKTECPTPAAQKVIKDEFKQSLEGGATDVPDQTVPDQAQPNQLSTLADVPDQLSASFTTNSRAYNAAYAMAYNRLERQIKQKYGDIKILGVTNTSQRQGNKITVTVTWSPSHQKQTVQWLSQYAR